MFWARRGLIRSFGAYKRGNSIKLRTDILKDLLESNQPKIEWDIVRNELLASDRSVRSANIDGIIMGSCFSQLRLDVAKSYAAFMKANSLEMNDAGVGKLLFLFYRHQQQTEAPLSEEDEEQIIQYSEALFKKHQTIDASLAENMIHALSITRNWSKCIELLPHIQFTGSAGASTISCIVSRAIDENRLDIAFKYVENLLDRQLSPHPEVLLKFFEKLQNDNVQTERLLNILSDNNFMLPERLLEEFAIMFRDTRKCTFVKVNRSGHCKSCHSSLSSNRLNNEEFEALSSTFFNDVILTKDVFLKTNPEEVNRYIRFVDKFHPFDCVIDGLNVAYSHGNGKSVQTFANNIALTLKYFKDRNNSCLVIGRKHMSHWPKNAMDYIKRNSHLFLADNISQDDPFLLYAALKSGPNAKIVSRDLMRSHSFLLDMESKKLFRRWQSQHQFSIITFLQGEVLIKEPIDFELRAQKVGSFWHIPFTNENHNFTYETFELPSSWLCLNMES